MNNLKDILAVSYEMADEPTASLDCPIVIDSKLLSPHAPRYKERFSAIALCAAAAVELVQSFETTVTSYIDFSLPPSLLGESLSLVRVVLCEVLGRPIAFIHVAEYDEYGTAPSAAILHLVKQGGNHGRSA